MIVTSCQRKKDLKKQIYLSTKKCRFMVYGKSDFSLMSLSAYLIASGVSNSTRALTRGVHGNNG